MNAQQVPSFRRMLPSENFCDKGGKVGGFCALWLGFTGRSFELYKGNIVIFLQCLFRMAEGYVRHKQVTVFVAVKDSKHVHLMLY